MKALSSQQNTFCLARVKSAFNFHAYQQRLGWEPSISLRTGLEHTYRWIYAQETARTPVRL